MPPERLECSCACISSCALTAPPTSQEMGLHLGSVSLETTHRVLDVCAFLGRVSPKLWTDSQRGL